MDLWVEWIIKMWISDYPLYRIYFILMHSSTRQHKTRRDKTAGQHEDGETMDTQEGVLVVYSTVLEERVDRGTECQWAINRSLCVCVHVLGAFVCQTIWSAFSFVCCAM